MHWKNYLLATAMVFIVGRMMVAFLFFGVVFRTIFDQPLPGARPEGQELHGPYLIVTLLWSLAFVHLFARTTASPGVRDGLRFGGTIWVFYFIPMVVCFWSYFDLPVDWMVASLASGLAESLVSGSLAGIVSGPRSLQASPDR